MITCISFLLNFEMSETISKNASRITRCKSDLRRRRQLVDADSELFDLHYSKNMRQIKNAVEAELIWTNADFAA